MLNFILKVYRATASGVSVILLCCDSNVDNKKAKIETQQTVELGSGEGYWFNQIKYDDSGRGWGMTFLVSRY